MRRLGLFCILAAAAMVLNAGCTQVEGKWVPNGQVEKARLAAAETNRPEQPEIETEVSEPPPATDSEPERLATPEETTQRLRTAFTDPARKRRTDPGHPEICNVYSLHHFYNPERLEEIARQCQGAEIGCVDCKQLLADGVNSALEPFRERRAEIAQRPGYANEVLAEGARRAQAIARETMKEVKEKMGLP